MHQGFDMNAQQTTFDLAVSSKDAALLPTVPRAVGDSSIGWRTLSADTGSVPGDQAAELWRQAVHDLRGRLSVVSTVTTLLQKPRSDMRRLELMATLDRNVAGLRDLLNGVADLARLDTQQERPVIGSFDVAAALAETGSSLRVMASSRGLRLEISGPASLTAETDPLMVARIAQNLVLNAVQYTRATGVALTYGLCGGTEPGHWYFDVGDATGVIPAPGGPGTAVSTGGEGIGLSIVGRLCRLLGGTMEISSIGGAGRTTRIKLPRRYVGVLEELVISSIGRRGAAAAGPWAPGLLRGAQAKQLALPPSMPAKPARFGG